MRATRWRVGLPALSRRFKSTSRHVTRLMSTNSSIQTIGYQSDPLPGHDFMVNVVLDPGATFERRPYCQVRLGPANVARQARM